MGIREYLKTSGNSSRLRLSAAFAVLFHALILAGGSLVMATQAEYGMAGAVAGGGQPQKVVPPEEQTVDLEDFSDDFPAERHSKPKPASAPIIPQGVGGPLSSGANEVPSYYRNPPPTYPEEARRLKEEGLVMLQTTVDAQGKVVSVSVSQSSGFPLLDESAVQTVMKSWQFKPARIGGLAISTSVNIPVRFRLKDLGL
ncbi:MAG TPA: energy transducer TonB [bacterium]|jgi:protein TonB|nr:energy transducer TonB [bacterium]